MLKETILYDTRYNKTAFNKDKIIEDSTYTHDNIMKICY